MKAKQKALKDITEAIRKGEYSKNYLKFDDLYREKPKNKWNTKILELETD